MKIGVVKWFNVRRGYGFIEKEEGGDIFVHYSDIAEFGFKTPAEGDQVIFDVEQGDKGFRATNVTKI